MAARKDLFGPSSRKRDQLPAPPFSHRENPAGRRTSGRTPVLLDKPGTAGERVTPKGAARFHPHPALTRRREFSPPRLRRWIKFASGQTPPIAMKPAGRLLDVLVRANRLDAGAPILSEPLPEAIADIGVASAGKFIEQDLAQKTRLELASRRSSSNIKTPDARAAHKKS
jgi:hypothetical protein